MDDEDETYFDSGSGNLLVQMRNADFRALLVRARWEHFATPVEDLDSAIDQQRLTPII